MFLNIKKWPVDSKHKVLHQPAAFFDSPSHRIVQYYTLIRCITLPCVLGEGVKDKISFVKMAYFYPRPRPTTHRAASSRPRSRRASPPSRCGRAPGRAIPRFAHIGRTSATRPAAANRRAGQFGRAPLGPVPRDPRGKLGPLFFVRARRMSARPQPPCARGKEARRSSPSTRSSPARCATSLLYGGDPRPNGVFVRHVARRTAGPRAKQGAPTRRPPVMGNDGTQGRLLSSGRTARAATRKAGGASAELPPEKAFSPLKPETTYHRDSLHGTLMPLNRTLLSKVMTGGCSNDA